MASHAHHQQQHYTVPIGGAPFIHPQLSQLSTSPPSISFASGSSHPHSHSPSSSLASSPSSRSAGSSDSTSSSPWSEGPFVTPAPSATEAALAYSRQLHRHTASMWESERLNIERSRLEKAGIRQGGSSSPPTKSPRASISAQGAAGGDSRDSSSSSSGGYRTLDFLLGRSRSKKEAPSQKMLREEREGKWSGSGSGHRRNRSMA